MTDTSHQLGEGELDSLLADAFTDHPFGPALAQRIKGEAVRRDRIDDSGRMAPVLAGPWSWRRLVPAAVAAAALFAVGYALYGEVDRDPTHTPVPKARIASVIGVTSDAALTLRRASGDTVALAPGERTSLVAGDEVLVESRGAVLAFADGTEVRVRPDTTVRVQRFEASEGRSAGTGFAIVGGPGEVFCEVARRPVGNAFLVASAFGTTEVLGTRFGVRVEPGRALTTVIEGRVRVRDRGGRMVQLRADEQSVTKSGVLTRAKVDARSELSWAVLAAAAVTEPAAAAATGSRPAALSPATSSPAAVSGDTGAGGLDMPIGVGRGDEDDDE